MVLRMCVCRVPLCKVINEYIAALATQFPEVKFLKSVADVCIPNYPDKNVPSIFIYFEDQLKKQFVGPEVFGGLRLKKDGKLTTFYVNIVDAMKTQMMY